MRYRRSDPGACAGLGGAVILVTYAGVHRAWLDWAFSPGGTIFGQWNPWGFSGRPSFGLASTIANVSQAIPALARSGILLKNFPYIVTLWF